MKLIRTKKFEMDLGLFGPELTYHTNDYPGDNARLVISLILFKLYITLPWNSKAKSFTPYTSYGVYSESDPDRLVFIWGNKVKALYMPWVRVLVSRTLLDVDNNPVSIEKYGQIPTYNELTVEIKFDSKNLNTIRSTKGYGYECEYYVTDEETRPLLFKWCKLFSKHSYSVVVWFNPEYNKCTGFTFNTEKNIALDSQINLQIMMRDKHYTDF